MALLSSYRCKFPGPDYVHVDANNILKLCPPTTILKSIPVLLSEVDIHCLSRYLRIGEFDMCNGQVVSDAHRWASCRRNGCRWAFLGSTGYCISYDSTPPAT